MFISKTRLVALSFVASLAVACTTTAEPGDPGESSSSEAANAEGNEVAIGDESDGEEKVGEQSDALCGVSCSYRMRSGPHYYYWCTGPCNGNGFWKPYTSWKGYSFCYSRSAC